MQERSVSDGMAEPGQTWWGIRMSGVQSPGIIQVFIEKTTTFFSGLHKITETIYCSLRLWS